MPFLSPACRRDPSQSSRHLPDGAKAGRYAWAGISDLTPSPRRVDWEEAPTPGSTVAGDGGVLSPSRLVARRVLPPVYLKSGVLHICVSEAPMRVEEFCRSSVSLSHSEFSFNDRGVPCWSLSELCPMPSDDPMAMSGDSREGSFEKTPAGSAPCRCVSIPALTSAFEWRKRVPMLFPCLRDGVKGELRSSGAGRGSCSTGSPRRSCPRERPSPCFCMWLPYEPLRRLPEGPIVKDEGGSVAVARC